jgi:hypothetical protein
MIVTMGSLTAIVKITPRQHLITTRKYRLAGPTMATRATCKKGRSPLCQSLPRCRQLPSSTNVLQIGVENLCRSQGKEI